MKDSSIPQRAMYAEVTPGVTCNLSMTTLMEAARKIGPQFVYVLHVSPSQGLWARGLLHDLGCLVRENPFSPYVNLVLWEDFAPTEWCLSPSGVREPFTVGYGSKGVM